MTVTGPETNKLGEISRVGVLGIGLMGSAMARRLLTQGISVTRGIAIPRKHVRSRHTARSRLKDLVIWSAAAGW